MSLVKFDTRPLTDPGQPIDMSWQTSSTGTHNLGLHSIDTVQGHILGRRYTTWDGKVYKYARSNAAWKTGLLAMHGSVAGVSPSIDWSALVQAQAIGDSYLIMAMQSTNTAAIVENAMAGGHITVNTVPPDAANAYLQERTIIANTAAAVYGSSPTALTYCTIYVNQPWNQALTTSSYAFLMASPYYSVGTTTSVARSAAGRPCAYNSAASQFGWIQTWGQCWVSGYSDADNAGKTNDARQLVFNASGGVGLHKYGTAGVTAQQHIGFILDNNESNNGFTVIMLQITPV